MQEACLKLLFVVFIYSQHTIFSLIVLIDTGSINLNDR